MPIQAHLDYGNGKITQSINPEVYGIQNTKIPKLHTTIEGSVTHTYVHTTYFKAYFMWTNDSNSNRKISSDGVE